MQGHSAASRIFQRPQGEREGAAREGRGRERRGQLQVRVFVFAVLDGRRLPAPPKAVRLTWTGLDALAPSSSPSGSWVSVSAHCRQTALHLASWSGHTESVRALLEKGADVNAANYHKCGFFLFDGRWLQAPARRCAVRLVVERVGAMQEHGTARRIFQRPHGEREGAAREGRGRERRGRRQVRVFLVA
jgi:hypothetical protein